MRQCPADPTPQGLDISKAMLDVAAEREVEGDLCLHDLVRIDRVITC